MRPGDASSSNCGAEGGRRDLFNVAEQARLVDTQAQGEQEKAESAPDVVGRAPVKIQPDIRGQQRAEDADGGDHDRAVAAQGLRQDFRHERDAAAEFAGQSEPGQEPADSID